MSSQASGPRLSWQSGAGEARDTARELGAILSLCRRDQATRRRHPLKYSNTRTTQLCAHAHLIAPNCSSLGAVYKDLPLFSHISATPNLQIVIAPLQQSRECYVTRVR